MDYQVLHKGNQHYLVFTPSYRSSDSRYDDQLGKAAIKAGLFDLSPWRPYDKDQLIVDLTCDQAVELELIETLIREAQHGIEHMMDELFRWRKIADVILPAQKPTKER